jgi:hypothetical protein
MKTSGDITSLLNNSNYIQQNTHSYLDKVNTILDNNTPTNDDYTTIVRKIDYRDIEYNKLKKINSTINIVYYICVGVLFILLYSENNLLLKDRFLFYIFLLLIPYLYPWAVILLKKIWNTLIPTVLTQGPKNAFLNNINTNYPDYRNIDYNNTIEHNVLYNV